MAFVIIGTVWTCPWRNSQSDLRYDLLSENIEALSEPEDKEYPRYINVTDKSSIKEFKTEIEKDSTGLKISVEYSRKCITYYTYCKHTGKTDDICYASLNKLEKTCDSWDKE